MTEEQSATVFGLTTLLTSRLIYNISKQIQQDDVAQLLLLLPLQIGVGQHIEHHPPLSSVHMI